jgi:hypothetical protein
VREPWRRESKRAMECDLPWGRNHEIVPSDDLVDLHRGVVDHDSQLISGHAVGPAQNEVVDAPGTERLYRAAHLIRERDAFPTTVEPNGRCAAELPRAGLHVDRIETAARSRIARSFLVFRVGRAQGARHVGSGASTPERATDAEEVVY